MDKYKRLKLCVLMTENLLFELDIKNHTLTKSEIVKTLGKICDLHENTSLTADELITLDEGDQNGYLFMYRKMNRYLVGEVTKLYYLNTIS